MKPSRLLTIGTVFAAVLSFALASFSPPAPEAQPPAAGVAGAYAEEIIAEQSTENFTTFILHTDGTMTLVESSSRQQNTFVGTWQQAADGLTVEGTVVGANISPVTEPIGMDPPPLEVSERDYSIVFQDNTYQIATVTSTRGPVDSFAARRISAPAPPAPPGTETDTSTDTGTDTGTEPPPAPPQ